MAVTAGYICAEPRAEFYRHMDAANVDLKGFSEAFYGRLCSAHLQPVLDTLVYLKHETDCWFEITNLIIPGENDPRQELDAMTRWIVDELGPDVPTHFTAFHPDWKMMDTPPTPPATLTRAREIAIGNGIRYVYTGNVHDPGRRIHLLPRLRRRADRPRLVRADRVEPDGRRPLRAMRHGLRRRLRRPARHLGSQAPAGPGRRLRVSRRATVKEGSH